MPDDMDEMYGGGGQETSHEDMPAKQGMDEGEDKRSDGEEALINSSVCPGMKPGDKFTVEIVESHDKEYLVRYLPDEKTSLQKGESDEMGSPPPSEMEEMYS